MAKFPSLAPVAQAVAKFAPVLGAIGKRLPLIGNVIGGIVGYTEAEATGRGKTEATLLGVLTGSAETGSGLAQMFGAEKGGAVDRTSGYIGAGVQGAVLGGVIGSMIVPGVGTVIGAAVGAGVGLLAEGYKHFTEKSRLDAKVAKDSTAKGSAAGVEQANLQTDRQVELESSGYTPKAAKGLVKNEQEIRDAQARREALSARVAADPNDTVAVEKLATVNEDIIKLSRERVEIEKRANAEYEKIQEEKHAAERLKNADKRYGYGYGAEGIKKEDETQQSSNRSKTDSAAQQAQMQRNEVAKRQQRLDMGDISKEGDILSAKRGIAIAARNQMDRDADANGDVNEDYKKTDKYKALQKEIDDLSYAMAENLKKKLLVSRGDTLNKDGSNKTGTEAREEAKKQQTSLMEVLTKLNTSIGNFADTIDNFIKNCCCPCSSKGSDKNTPEIPEKSISTKSFEEPKPYSRSLKATTNKGAEDSFKEAARRTTKRGPEELFISAKSFEESEDPTKINALLESFIRLDTSIGKLTGLIDNRFTLKQGSPSKANGGLLNGPSHANGGIAMMNRSGKQIAEAEGGEWVVNKRDSKKSSALLSRINAGEEFAMAGKGVLAQGGNTSNYSMAAQIPSSREQIEKAYLDAGHPLSWISESFLKKLDEKDEKEKARIKEVEYQKVVGRVIDGRSAAKLPEGRVSNAEMESYERQYPGAMERMGYNSSTPKDPSAPSPSTNNSSETKAYKEPKQARPDFAVDGHVPSGIGYGWNMNSRRARDSRRVRGRGSAGAADKTSYKQIIARMTAQREERMNPQRTMDYAQPFGTKNYTREQAEARIVDSDRKYKLVEQMMGANQRSQQFGDELADIGKQIEMPNRQQNASVYENSPSQQDRAAQNQVAANFQIDFLERGGAVQTAKLSLPNAETLDAFKEAMVAKMNQQGQMIETQGRGLSNLNGSIHPPARL